MNRILTTIVALALILWVIFDPSWIDVWAFNKEIIMTNLARWIPVAIAWSLFDNIVDRLFQGSKLEKWLLKTFRHVPK
jgi:ABC-type maltose transport system permease subunit